ncbi:MAG: preprotein translocase subunit SecY, partial [Bradyrhizobium sp.]
VPGAGSIVVHPGIGFILMAVISLSAGSAFVMWIGEQITDRGIGNGISLIIFAGIVARMPAAISSEVTLYNNGQASPLKIVGILALVFVVVGIIIFCERGQRKIPVPYAKRVVGRKMYGGQSTHLPLKINTAGVIPPIFASSLLMMPVSVLNFIPVTKFPYQLQGAVTLIQSQLQHGQATFMILYGLLIIGFAFFYTSIVFNPDDTAENLRKYGGNLPGIRPGKRTAEYIDHVLTRLTVIGAAYITAVCLLPEFVIASSPTIASATTYFSGTSVLIVVTVTMDTVSQIQSHLLAHQYEGLIRKSRLRGARR